MPEEVVDSVKGNVCAAANEAERADFLSCISWLRFLHTYAYARAHLRGCQEGI